VVTDPEPQVSVWPLHRKAAVIQTDAGRPDFLAEPLSDLLKLERAVLRICFEQPELFVRPAADFLRVAYPCQKPALAR
jgi:hypothetical protein